MDSRRPQLSAGGEPYLCDVFADAARLQRLLRNLPAPQRAAAASRLAAAGEHARPGMSLRVAVGAAEKGVELIVATLNAPSHGTVPAQASPAVDARAAAALCRRVQALHAGSDGAVGSASSVAAARFADSTAALTTTGRGGQRAGDLSAACTTFRNNRGESTQLILGRSTGEGSMALCRSHFRSWSALCQARGPRKHELATLERRAAEEEGRGEGEGLILRGRN